MSKFNLRELTPYLRRLQSQVGKLRLGENFQPSFQETVTIPAGESLLIKNRLQVVPAKRLIVRQSSYFISDGDTWSEDYVSLKNDDSSDAIVTVIFYAY